MFLSSSFSLHVDPTWLLPKNLNPLMFWVQGTHIFFSQCSITRYPKQNVVKITLAKWTTLFPFCREQLTVGYQGSHLKSEDKLRKAKSKLKPESLSKCNQCHPLVHQWTFVEPWNICGVRKLTLIHSPAPRALEENAIEYQRHSNESCNFHEMRL